MTKKSSAAVSSWGFSGYITVLPKESKPDVVENKQTKPGEKERPKSPQEPRTC